MSFIKWYSLIVMLVITHSFLDDWDEDKIGVLLFWIFFGPMFFAVWNIP
jgi:hypothetical protein